MSKIHTANFSNITLHTWKLKCVAVIDGCVCLHARRVFHFFLFVFTFYTHIYWFIVYLMVVSTLWRAKILNKCIAFRYFSGISFCYSHTKQIKFKFTNFSFVTIYYWVTHISFLKKCSFVIQHLFKFIMPLTNAHTIEKKNALSLNFFCRFKCHLCTSVIWKPLEKKAKEVFNLYRPWVFEGVYECFVEKCLHLKSISNAECCVVRFKISWN